MSGPLEGRALTAPLFQRANAFGGWQPSAYAYVAAYTGGVDGEWVPSAPDQGHWAEAEAGKTGFNLEQTPTFSPPFEVSEYAYALMIVDGPGENAIDPFNDVQEPKIIIKSRQKTAELVDNRTNNPLSLGAVMVDGDLVAKTRNASYNTTTGMPPGPTIMSYDIVSGSRAWVTFKGLYQNASDDADKFNRYASIDMNVNVYYITSYYLKGEMRVSISAPNTATLYDDEMDGAAYGFWVSAVVPPGGVNADRFDVSFVSTLETSPSGEATVEFDPGKTANTTQLGWELELTADEGNLGRA